MSERVRWFLVVAVLGAILGAAAGWAIGRRSSIPARGYAVRTRAILTNADGRPIGEIGPGVIVVTSIGLGPEGELGWWGYVPVYFGTGSEAARIVDTSPQKIASPFSVSHRALLPAELPAQ